MSKRYPGNFITGNPVALSQTSNNGIWDLTDNYTATNNSTWQEPSGIYQIGRSLRFRSGSSTYLERTPSVSGSRTTFTISVWTKWCAGSSQIFGVTSGSGTSSTQEDNRLAFQHSSDGQIQFYEFVGGSFAARKYTADRFRDPSAWYHIVARINYSESSAANRIKIYVNGVEITAFSDITDPSLNRTSYMNGSGNRHTIGGQIKQFNNFYDGYLTEVNVIDGQALDPSFFGYFDPITNIWQPKRYTGSYGTNGFYLPFSENQSTANLGRNFAGSNRITYSQTFENGIWAKVNGGITPAATTAPDGTLTGAKFIPTVTGGVEHLFYQGSLFPSTPGVYTYSLYVKPAGYNFLAMRLDTETTIVAVFDLVNGTLTESVSSGNYKYNITAVQNGWYRVSISAYGNVLANIVTYPLPTRVNALYAGDGTSGVFVWGSQLNYGWSADTYIPTAATAANNDWTPNNFSLTAGATYDSMVDSPTNVFTTANDTGGVVPGNYPTWNPLISANFNNTPSLGSTLVSYSNGLLTDSVSTAGGNAPRMHTISTMGFPTSGKWYWEVTGLNSNTNVGITRGQLIVPSGSGPGMEATLSYGASGGFGLGSNVTGTALGTALTATSTDIIGIAFDADASSISWYKNNTFMCGYTNITYTGSTHRSYPWVALRGLDTSNGSASSSVNFGQRPFAYTPPAGFRSLNTTNIQALGSSVTANAGLQPSKWMDSTIWSGVGTAPHNIENSGFKPDMVWVKTRNATNWPFITDSARGTPLKLYTNSTNGEDTTPIYGEIISFNNNGFTVDAGTGDPGGTLSDVNQLGVSYVAWQWRQSPAAGFTMVTYTGDGIDGRNITHNLGVAPSMCIIHTRNDPSARSWPVWTSALTTQSSGSVFTSSNFNVGSKSGGVLSLNLTAAAGGYGMDGQSNANGSTYVAYLWAEVPGFSKFGTYIGNGSTDGPFVNLGFRPKWIMIKNASVSEQWAIIDTGRFPFNDSTAHILFANSNGTEDLNASFHQVDFVSNGFKVRGASQPLVNQSANTFFYAAFAESPFALNNRAR
jgi:hypothetical protein